MATTNAPALFQIANGKAVALQVIKAGPRKTRVSDGQTTWSIDTRHIDSPFSGVRSVEAAFREIEAAKKKYADLFGQRNETNFHLASEANFTSCDRPDREPDYVSGSGSCYWYTEDGVVRGSDHWLPFIATCDWSLDEMYYNRAGERFGFCAFADFAPNTERKMQLDDVREDYESALRLEAMLNEII